MATATPGSTPVEPTLPELHPGLIASIVGGAHPRPHDTLGQHQFETGYIIRVIRPLAATVTAIRADATRVTLDHVADGLWQGFAPGLGQAYSIETTYAEGPDWVADDPYRFVPSVGDIDLYLFGEGRHEQMWSVFGSHYRPQAVCW